MQLGYIYALKNRSFGDYVIKIGRTTREPDTRAREIYSGSTGVPEPFDIAFVCQVGDCSKAEKEVHRKLEAYRKNKDREFFIIPLEVARKIIINVCQQVNKSLGNSVENLIIFDVQNPDDSDFDLSSSWTSSPDIVEVPITQLRLSPPIVTNSLSKRQEERIEIIAEIFKNVFPQALEEWNTGFIHDTNPEDEICIWENIAKAFLKVDQVKYLTHIQKEEAFCLLVLRSMMTPSKTLEAINLRTLSRRVAKEILRGYEAEPKPMTLI